MKQADLDSIYEAGLVSEALEVQRILDELESLKKLVESGKPVCPYCRTEMEPVNYWGYYESFSMWDCSCDPFPKEAGAPLREPLPL